MMTINTKPFSHNDITNAVDHIDGYELLKVHFPNITPQEAYEFEEGVNKLLNELIRKMDAKNSE